MYLKQRVFWFIFEYFTRLEFKHITMRIINN